jgi:hypothetical protein
VNPLSQIYKIAAGKTKVSKTTSINRPDGSETTGLQETLNEILNHLYKEHRGDENPHHKSIRKAFDDPFKPRATKNLPLKK